MDYNIEVYAGIGWSRKLARLRISVSKQNKNFTPGKITSTDRY